MSRILSVISIIAVLWITGCVSRLDAQEIAKLPDDPRIKTGKLDNGLSYYLVSNPYLEGHADVYLLQNTGTSVEDSTEKGITSIISNLGIRSTRNFPGTMMLNYLKTKGVRLNKDLEIELNKESCQYRLLNIPVNTNKHLHDSTLLMLFNWSCNITFDTEDVEKGKLYVRNMLTGAEDVSERLENDYLRQLLKGSSYNPPQFDDLLDSIEEYSPKEIQSYYYQWFRPDLQAVVVVGDINVPEVETQIKALFQAVPRGINPEKIVNHKIENNKELEVAIAIDKEATTSKVRLMFKVDVISRDLKETAVPYVMDYMNSLITYLIKERLIVLSRTTKFPIISHDVRYGKYFGIKEKNALSVEVETDPESVPEAIAFITLELENIRRNGFSRSEFIRARDVFFERLIYMYNWRDLLDNKTYADRCVHGFLDGYLLASIELHTEYMEKVKQEMSTANLNSFVSSYIRQQGENCVLTCSYPEKGGVEPLSVSQIKELYQKTIALEPIPYEDEKIISKFLEKNLSSGKIKHETPEPISKSTLFNLANGARVILKNIKNQPERFQFRAIAKGGLSLYEGDVSIIEPFIDDIASIGGYTQTSSANLERLMMEKNMSLSKTITAGHADLSGSAYTQDLKIFMELVYLNFLPKKENLAELDRYKNIKNAQYQFISNNPDAYFEDPFADKRGLLNKLNYSEVNKFLEKLYSNAADFTFIIVGDFNEEVTRKMMLEYIGSLQGNPNKKRIINPENSSFKRNRFRETTHLEMDMEIPRYYYSLEMDNEYPLNVENKIMSDLISWIIGQKVVEQMAMEMEILVDVNCKYEKYPEEVFCMEFSFVTKSFSESNMSYLRETLHSISREGVGDKELKVLKTMFKDKFIVKEKTDNSFWTEIIVDRFIYGKDLYSKYLTTLEALKLEDVNEALSDFIDNGVIDIKTMSPK